MNKFSTQQTTQFHSRFHETLQQHRRELLDKINRAREQAMSADESPADPADLSAQAVTREYIFAQADSSHRLLRLVDQAISRMHEGTFGTCIECGEPISVTRLRAIPWATRCIACQEAREGRQERQAA